MVAEDDAAMMAGVERFVREHAAAESDEGFVRTVLERLPRSPEHVLDLSAGGERVLVASVLDTLENASGSALLAFLGYRDTPDAAAVVARALDLAEALVRRGPKRRLDVSLSKPLRRHVPLLVARGYTPAYTQRRMARGASPVPAAPPLPAGLRWEDATEAHAEAYRAVAAAALAGTLGSHMPSVEVLRAALRDAPLRPRLLLDGERLAGIARIGLDAAHHAGLVLLIARDPARRGQRLGDRLVIEALRALEARGARRYELEVNSENAVAMALYRRHGFEVEDEETTYRRDLAP